MNKMPLLQVAHCYLFEVSNREVVVISQICPINEFIAANNIKFDSVYNKYINKRESKDVGAQEPHFQPA